MTSKSVDFYFDLGSPAAYLAWTQLPQICEKAGARLVYKPMLLGGVFKAIGNQSPANIPAKGRYMDQDLTRCARRFGVPFLLNPHFPINTLLLMRGAAGLQLRGDARFEDYLGATYRAIWVERRNMNDPATVGAALQAAGFDAPALLALTNEPEVKEALKATTEEAVQRGVFGAPTFFIGDEMFWGQDRLDFVRAALLS